MKEVISGLPIEQMAGRNRFPANVPYIPPSSPEDLPLKNSKNTSSCSAETNISIETIENLKNRSMGLHVK